MGTWPGLGHALGRLPETIQNLRWSQSSSSPLVWEQTSLCVHFSWVESKYLTAPLPVPLVFKPAKGTYLPSVQAQGWGVQYVVWTTHSPGRILSLCNRSWSDCFSFLLSQIHVDLSYSLGCIRVFLPISSLFSVRTTSHVDAFPMFSWGKVSSASSYSTILISPVISLNTGCCLTIWHLNRLIIVTKSSPEDKKSQIEHANFSQLKRVFNQERKNRKVCLYS